MRLAKSRQAHGYNISVEDLIGEGFLGLLDAARSYDVSKGTRFSTYAVCRIRGRMLDYLRAESDYGRGKQKRTFVSVSEHISDSKPSILDLLASENPCPELYCAIMTVLTSQQRLVLTDFYWRKLSARDIVERSHAPSAASVGTTLCLARRKLRTHLTTQ